MSSGALTPAAAAGSVYHDALHHLKEPISIAFVKNIAGGAYMSFASFTAMRVAGGMPNIKESDMGVTFAVEGAIFAIGLVLVYFTGAEVITGYPMWLTIAALKRKGNPFSYIVALLNSFLGNLIGALLIAVLFAKVTGSLDEEPFRSFVISRVEEDIIDSQWYIIFVKAIACGYLVTLAMFLGTQNMDGISKALGLWLPFALATTAHLPHTVKYMHLAPTGMMLGANLSIGGFLGKCMAPIFLGNFVGGSAMGLYHWWVFLVHKDGTKKGNTFSDAANNYRDEDDDGNDDEESQ